MKKYLDNKKNVIWYKKLDILSIIVVCLLTFAVSFGILYFLGGTSRINMAFRTSTVIALLITISFALTQLLENRNAVYMIDRKIRYIELHDSKDGKFLSDEEFRSVVDSKKLMDIYNNIKDYEGIDCGEIIEILKINKRVNRIVLIANVKAKVWSFKSKFFSSDIHLIDKEYKRKFVIPNDYDKYDELYENLLKHKK